VVPTGNPKWLTSSRESVEFIWCAIAGLFRSRAALQAEILLPPAQCSVPLIAEAGGPWQDRSPGILRALSLAPTVLDALNILQPEIVIYPLASRWVRSLLALEITTARRSASDPRGHSPAHSRDERGNPLWEARDSWRTARARDRRRQSTVAKYIARRRQPVARLENLPSQSCRWRFGDPRQRIFSWWYEDFGLQCHPRLE
jgi:hypothetical protein